MRVFKLKKAERVGESSGVRSDVMRLVDHQTSTKAVEEGGRGVERREGGGGREQICRRERECEGRGIGGRERERERVGGERGNGRAEEKG